MNSSKLTFELTKTDNMFSQKLNLNFNYKIIYNALLGNNIILLKKVVKKKVLLDEHQLLN